jgi:hypothetical protein
MLIWWALRSVQPRHTDQRQSKAVVRERLQEGGSLLRLVVLWSLCVSWAQLHSDESRVQAMTSHVLPQPHRSQRTTGEPLAEQR